MMHFVCKCCVFVLSFLLFLGITPAAIAQTTIIRYVDDDAATGGNGLSWGTSYKHLQDALTEAYTLATGNTIVQLWVASGTYYPDRNAVNPTGTGDREVSFVMASNVKLYGGFAGNEAATTAGFNQRRHTTNLTILSGDLEMDDEPDFVNYQDNSYHVVTAPPNVGNGGLALLDGFIIIAGNADGDPGQIDHSNRGGGIFVFSSHPVIVREGGNPAVRELLRRCIVQLF